jgi:hypothetical protein
MRPDTIFTNWLLCRALTSALLGAMLEFTQLRGAVGALCPGGRRMTARTKNSDLADVLELLLACRISPHEFHSIVADAQDDIHSRQGRPAGHCRARTTSPEVANTVERTVTELAGRGYRALAVARSGDGGKTWAARTKQSVKALPSAFAPQAVPLSETVVAAASSSPSG